MDDSHGLIPAHCGTEWTSAWLRIADLSDLQRWQISIYRNVSVSVMLRKLNRHTVRMYVCREKEVSFLCAQKVPLAKHDGCLNPKKDRHHPDANSSLTTLERPAGADQRTS